MIAGEWKDITEREQRLANGNWGLFCLNADACLKLALFEDRLAHGEKLRTTHSSSVALDRCENAIIGWLEVVN